MKQQTVRFVLLKVTMDKEVNVLEDKIANRTYTIDGVKDVEVVESSEVSSQDAVEAS